MHKAALVIAPFMLFAATAAAAQETPWRVTEVSGNVRIADAAGNRPATRGALLSSGATIATAGGARAVLVRGQDYVTVSPNSRLRVPTEAQHGRTGLIQMLTDWGTALFRIEHQATPHFGVQTPYLAAVVKGTVFTVTVGGQGASVQVTQGAVEVSTVDGGAAEMVRPGTIAMVASSDLLQLNIEGETSRAIRSNGTPTAGVVTVPAPDAYAGPADAPAVIAAPVAEDPVTLRDATDGLVDGRTGADLALADATRAGRDDDGAHDAGGHDDTGTSGGGHDDAGSGDHGGSGSGGDTGSGDDHGHGGGTGGTGGTDDDGHGGGDHGGDSGGTGTSGGGDDHGGDNGGSGHDDDGSNSGHGGGSGDNGGSSGSGGSGDNSGPGGSGDNGGTGTSNDDDGNNGHGNDDDGQDDSNPGHGGGHDDDDGGSGDSGGGSGSGGSGGGGGLHICLPADLLCIGIGGSGSGGGGHGPH